MTETAAPVITHEGYEKVLTRNVGVPRAYNLDVYEQRGGYTGLKKALTTMKPPEVGKLVLDSGLRGRGGAGFPTGQKWSFVPKADDVPGPRYLIANADEMEPGTFKDRLLLEGDPHSLIEGLIVSAYAIGATTVFIFLRDEYRLAAGRLRRAIAEAADAGWLGEHIQGGEFGVEMHLHTSAGRYICGEETALINSLEGRRAIPRAKPPFPQAVGLWGRPTVVNNVETLCNVPHIVERGADWFKSLSRSKDSGTKIYGVSGKVRQPGAWELPMGTTIREVFEGHAGGMRDGYTFRGLLPGGASTDFLVEEHLDTPMDFDSIQHIGSRLGTGTMIVLDDKTCPVAMVRNLEHFFAQESCGWCTPCRDGLPFVESLLDGLERGTGRPGDLDLLEMHTRFLGPGKTFCAHAPGAMEPLQSALKYFRDDFERHVKEGRCPYR
jgi:NADH-quinone oxidoreductase subunit F